MAPMAAAELAPAALEESCQPARVPFVQALEGAETASEGALAR